MSGYRGYITGHIKNSARICEGGDLYEKEQSFFTLVQSREESMVENWLDTLDCPVFRIDGTLPIADNVGLLIEKLRENHLI